MKSVIFFLILLFSAKYTAQRNTDSLKSVLQNQPDNAQILFELGRAYQVKSPQLAFRYLQLGLTRAVATDDYQTQGACHLEIGNYYFTEMDYKSSGYHYRKAIIKAQQVKDYSIQRKCYSNIGQILCLTSRPKDALRILNKALQYIPYEKEQGEKQKAYITIYGIIGDVYKSVGLYDRALYYLLKAKRIYDQHPIYGQSPLFMGIGSVYLRMESHKKALEWYDKAEKIAMREKDAFNQSQIEYNIIYCHYLLKHFEKAERMINKIQSTYRDKGGLFLIKASICIEKKLTYKSLRWFDKAIDFYLSTDNKELLAYCYAEKSSALIVLHQNRPAKELLLKSVGIFSDIGSVLELKDIYGRLAFTEKQLGNFRNATLYMIKKDSLQEIIFNHSRLETIANQEIKYDTELKESKIEVQQLEIAREKANKNFILMVTVCLFTITIGGSVYYRNIQKNRDLTRKNTELKLQQEIGALELSVLNKRLNPHFINNALTAMTPSFERNTPEIYNSIVKLTRLIGSAFENESLTDSIAEQLEGVQNYIDLQKLIFKDQLQYTVQCSIGNMNQQIPRLLLQNLVENAVEHGIEKKGKGHIIIRVTEDREVLTIEVEDDGCGRTFPEKQGVGTATYQNLFRSFNTTNTGKATLLFTDKKDESGDPSGTIARVSIPKTYYYKTEPQFA